MHFEIRSALQPGKQLTAVQRKSGFSEAPTVAGKVLRRGVVLKLTPDQVKLNYVQIRTMLLSQSVIVDHVHGEYHRTLNDLTPGLLSSEITDEVPSESGERALADDSGDAGGASGPADPPAEEATRHDLKADIVAEAPHILKAVLTTQPLAVEAETTVDPIDVIKAEIKPAPVEKKIETKKGRK